MRARFLMLVAQLAIACGVVALWEWAARTGHVNRSFLGSPGGVYHTLSGWISDGTVAAQLRSTLEVLALGFGGSIVVGTAIGVACALSPFVDDVLSPFLVFINGLPRLILQPLFIIWFGFGVTSKVVLVISVLFVLIALNVSSVVIALDRDLVANARLQGARVKDLALHVYLPWVGLDLLAMARLNVGLAFQAVIVAEFVGTTSGIGYLIVKGQNTFDVNAIWAALAIVVVVAVVLDVVFALVQDRASKWMPRLSV